METKAKKPRQLNNHQKVIQRFVTIEFTGPKARNFWSLQMKLARELIEQYGVEFLLQMPPPSNYKVANLLWFKSKEGQNYLSDQLFEYNKANTNLYPDRADIKLETAIIAEDVKLEPRKPRTLKEFINFYGKKG